MATISIPLGRTTCSTSPTTPARSRQAISYRRVGFLFHEIRAEQHVDLALERGTQIVGLIDAAGEADEIRAEIAVRLAQADCVFDLPELLVDRFEALEQRIEFRR